MVQPPDTEVLNVCAPAGVREAGMGGWAKLNSDYAAQMIAWLRVALK